MFSAVTSFFANLFYKNHDPPMDMADIDKILSDLERENIETSSQVEEILYQNEESCFYASGIVSAVRDDYVLIDNKYLCDINRVDFQVKIGDKIRYFAYQLDKNKELKIHKIMHHDNLSWDEENNEDNMEIIKKSEPIVKGQIMNRTLVGKIMRREGRKIYSL
ncbi:uncharacterized protein LOC127283218 [Leptopilina boulardi]|uniref:uncharacterized protein LOC127283218 n=1 Tax=Leptopilina boulardi TaxID=63433 RepID=UPI0021F67E81|nr:uncharacterized protein LOC127283218 [Leptopilina boulardi]